MPSGEQLLLFGASVRAAAFSALRAGLRPWCADLFGDADLQGCAPTQRLSPESYPQEFVRLCRQGPPGPWMYTGGLENRPGLVLRLSHFRPLWGNDATVLQAVRSPRTIQMILQAANLPHLEVHSPADQVPQGGHWLVKPGNGAGGSGIRFWERNHAVLVDKDLYLQEYKEGDACAAIFIGDGCKATLLGVTWQLVGLSWLHARPFAYCGSVGPIHLSSSLQLALDRLGDVLTDATGLRGIFGLDFILRDDVPWLVEVNPRYTASVEVLECALGISALAGHRDIFDPPLQTGPRAIPHPQWGNTKVKEKRMIGKAILFARAPLAFPNTGPWLDSLEEIPTKMSRGDLWEPSPFADIPHGGDLIETGRPILSFFIRGNSLSGCLDHLRLMAADLDQRFWKT
jgi:predicted ATP-grasp superfamily ATP-dependent carboligase